MANKNRYNQHFKWYNQAGKEFKDFFFVAIDITTGEEDYPQYFEDKEEFNIELSRVASLEQHTNIVASYNLDEDFDVQYERQFPNCSHMQIARDLDDFHQDLEGLNRKAS
jgi:hypothetical protein